MLTLTANPAPQSLEATWRERADSLAPSQLEGSLWSDLHKALKAACEGRCSLAARWVDSVEEHFLAIWDSYEESDIWESEITSESVLGHRLLQEGVEAWLSALCTFRTALDRGRIVPQAVLEDAEIGQRLLIAVQLREAETQDCVSHFLAAWAN